MKTSPLKRSLAQKNVRSNEAKAGLKNRTEVTAFQESNTLKTNEHEKEIDFQISQSPMNRTGTFNSVIQEEILKINIVQRSIETNEESSRNLLK
jgi:hypothetical protein